MFSETIVVGRVGRDAEVRDTAAGKVCTFSVAASVGRDKTIWYKVTTWNKLAENDAQYVKKGMLVLVRGQLQADANGQPRTYEKDGVVKSAGFELTAYETRYLTRVQVEAGDSAQPSLENEEEIPF